MRQSRRMSLVECAANVAVGFGVALLTQVAVFPLFGVHLGGVDHLAITGVFTVVSIVRSYILRRAFEWARVRGVGQ